MTERHLGPCSGDGDQWERLLCEFFAQEVPESLRHLEALTTPAVGSLSRVNASQGRAAAVVAAAAVVLMTVALGTQTGRLPAISKHPAESNAPGASAGMATAQAAHGDTDLRPAEPARETWTEEQYNTPQGPVVQRTNIRWTEVSVVEPETGAEVDLLLPELNIEVFPIEDPGASDDRGP